MTHSLQQIKTMTLAVAILLGLAVNCARLDAGRKDTAIVAGGCFWCVEADFESVPGVIEVVSGFTGGTVPNPSYKQVKSGKTGHYEAVQIIYDPRRVSYEELMSMFFRSIDPTDAGGQFCDRGKAYRTAIFVADPNQKAAAEAARANAQRALGQKVVTRILTVQSFYVAEDKHQDFYKGKARVITRFGIKRQADAYAAYRKACGRDARVRALWGAKAPFAT